MTSLVWFRSDLRLSDNPALTHAARDGAVVPVFIHAPEEESPWEPGAASRWWLHRSLAALEIRLREAGSRLVIRRGRSLDVLRDLAKETRAGAVVWNRRYEPAVIVRDAEVKAALKADGLAVESFNGALLREPWTVENKSRKPFQVFTPFWKHCLALSDPARPTPPPKYLPAPLVWPKSLDLASLELEPVVDWTQGLNRAWQPGEDGARARLKSFLETSVERYSDCRNRPDLAGTSRLSPHLRFGEISPGQIWHELERMAARRGWPAMLWRRSSFVAELGWREFAHHLLYHFPHTAEEPLRPEFKHFPWRDDPAALKAWQKGRTGFPIVDAGIRELWSTGWMHNRVRMIAASFLIKDLMTDWRAGARWFWDTLVDADLAQNTLGWQWTAGCGADAAPYFRVFNPASQGEKFDPDGDYVRRWCPELSRLPNKYIHRPHECPDAILREAGVELGRDYPQPLVSHASARNLALEAFERLKSASGKPAIENG